MNDLLENSKSKTIINERDIRIFNLLRMLGWIREDIIARYLGFDFSDKKVQNNMNSLAYRLKKDNFIRREKVLAYKPCYWSLGVTGAKFINCQLAKNIVLTEMNHDDYIAELVVNILLQDKYEVRTEYEINQELSAAERKNLKIPDIVINNDIAIEVELTRKDDKRLIEVINKYHASNFKHVIYYITNQQIAKRIAELSNYDQHFEFRLFKESIFKYEVIKFEKTNSNELFDQFQQQPRNENGTFASLAEERLAELMKRNN